MDFSNSTVDATFSRIQSIRLHINKLHIQVIELTYDETPNSLVHT